VRADRDGFHFDELVGPAQDGDAEQGAGSVVVTEGGSDDAPDRAEILLPRGGDGDGRLDDVGESGACGRTGLLRVMAGSEDIGS